MLDGAAALGWCFEDERTPALDALRLRVAEHGAVVPSLWRLEVASGLLAAARRSRLAAARRDALLAALLDMDIAIDTETDLHAWSGTVRLAEAHGLTAYDAAYLELAQRRRLPLATLDTALARAAREAGVVLSL